MSALRAVIIQSAFVALLCLAAFMPATVESGQGMSERESNQLMAEAVHILGGFRNRVPRWTDPLRVAIVGEVDTETTQTIRSLLGQVSTLTGLDYKVLRHLYRRADQYLVAVSNLPRYELAVCNGFKHLECANFLVFVTSQSTMHQITRSIPMRRVFQKATAGRDEVACFFSPGISADFVIRRTIVFVNDALDRGMLKTCLQEEIVQSFGLFNDYTGSRYFSFNNVVDEKQLTRFDRTLLTSLYDKALPTGAMATAVAKEVVDYCRLRC